MTSGVSYTVKDSSGLGKISRQTSVIHKKGIIKDSGGPGSSLLSHLPKEFSLRLTWCPWLIGYYGIRGLVKVYVSWPGHPRYLKKKIDSGGK